MCASTKAFEGSSGGGWEPQGQNERYRQALPGRGWRCRGNCQAISASQEHGLCVGNVRAAQEASLESGSLPKNEIIIALKIPEKQRLVEILITFSEWL